MPLTDESGKRYTPKPAKKKKTAPGKSSNGLYDYGTGGDLRKAAREAAVKADRRNIARGKKRGGYKGFDTAGAINKEYNANQKAAKRRVQASADAKMSAYRRGRIKQGAFAGDYYGPDEFKGNLARVDAWRKAGGKKSDIKRFAKKFK